MYDSTVALNCSVAGAGHHQQDAPEEDRHALESLAEGERRGAFCQRVIV